MQTLNTIGDFGDTSEVFVKSLVVNAPLIICMLTVISSYEVTIITRASQFLPYIDTMQN